MRDYLIGLRDRRPASRHVRFGVRVDRDRAARRRPGGTAGAWRRPTARRARYTRRDGRATATCAMPHLPEYPGEFTGRQIHSGAYRSIDRHRGHARADGRVPATRAATSPSTSPTARLESDDLDPARAAVPAQGGVRRARAASWLAGQAAGRASTSGSRACYVRTRRSARRDGVPRPAGAGDPQPQRPAAGGQQPAAVLDPARPDRRRAGRSSASTGSACTSPTARAASSTRSCGRPASSVSSRSSTRRCCSWRDGVPLRTAGLTLPVGAENLYFIGLAAPRGPQLPVYSRQAELVARMLRLDPARRSALAEHFAETDVARRAHRHRPRDLAAGRCATPSKDAGPRRRAGRRTR